MLAFTNHKNDFKLFFYRRFFCFKILEFPQGIIMKWCFMECFFAFLEWKKGIQTRFISDVLLLTKELIGEQNPLRFHGARVGPFN